MRIEVFEWEALVATPVALVAYAGLAWGISRAELAVRGLGALAGRSVRWLKHFSQRIDASVAIADAIIILIGLGATVATGLFADSIPSGDMVPRDFFGTSAQILPVFLVALAVEQRLAQRLGTTAAESAHRAETQFQMAIDAQIEYEDGDVYDRGRRLAEQVEPEFSWLFDYTHEALYGDPDDQPDIAAIARKRFAPRRRGEAGLIVAAVAVIVVGEASALSALSGNQSISADGWLFGLTAGCLAGALLIVTLAALRDLLPAVWNQV